MISAYGYQVDGTHEPIIAKDLFDKVQTILKRQTTNPRFYKHNPLFKSKMFCKCCGGMVTWEIQKDCWYGHCNNHGESKRCPNKTYIKLDTTEGQVISFFQGISPKIGGILSIIEEAIKQEHSQIIAEREIEIQRLNGLLRQAKINKEKYFEAKIEGKAPAEYCDEKIIEYTDEEEALKAALVVTIDKGDELHQLRLIVHQIAFHAEDIYEKATIDEKRLLMSQIFTNLTQNRYEIEPNYTPVADYLKNWMPKLFNDYELQQMLMNKGKTEDFASTSPVLGG